MIKINLAPPAVKPGIWNRPLLRFLLLATSVSIFLTSVSRLHLLQRELSCRSASHSAILEKSLTASSSADLIDQNQADCNEARRRITVLKGFRTKTLNLTNTLDLVGSCLPDGDTRLTQLKHRQREVLLKGQASTFSAITELVVCLDDASSVSSVALKSWSELETGFSFELLLEVKHQIR